MERSPEGAAIRRARADDVDAIHHITVSAFGAAEGSERWAQWRRHAEQWEGFLILERAGEPVGATWIGRHPLRFGQASVLLKGDVGHVSILPELQGQGLGSLMMRETVRFMDEQGFPISRLGGLCAFYRRFDYVPFPRLYYEFPLGSVQAGASALSPETFLAPQVGEEERVRPYHPEGDWLERCRLYDCFNAGRTGSLVEDRPAAPGTGGPDETGLRWVYQGDDGLRACAFASITGSTVEIHEAISDPADPEALVAVVRRALWEAVRKGATQGLGRLPFDHRVEAALVEGGVPFHLREMHTAPASNMLLLVSLPRFVETALPEWRRRLLEAGASGWAGALELQVQGQTVKLAVAPDGLELAHSGARANAHLAMPPPAFLLAALGFRGWYEVAAAAEGDAPPALANILGVVFRREPLAAGPLG